MKKTTLFISSLVLSTVLVFGQSSRKAAPITKTTQLNAIDENLEQSLIQNVSKTPSGHIRCFTTESEQIRRSQNPSLESTDQFENWLSQKIKEIQLNPSLLKASRNIPVVVHVIHNGDAVGSGENISVAQINSQITVLNQDYSATNADFSSVPAVFNSAKGNMDIQFCLAVTNPSGQPTTGINRVQLTAANYGDQPSIEAIKPGTQWDPTKYLNIWVVRVDPAWGLLGYAQFPTSSGLSGLTGGVTTANTDGVVIAHNAFGSTGAAQSPFNKGRTATHEIGHWLGLRHIGGDQSGGCGNDFCADTPPQKGGLTSNFTGNDFGQNYDCPTHPLVRAGECAGTTAEMFMNYMDYTNDNCMYMFTNNQKSRMDAVLLNSPRRASLLTSNVCSAAAITADFTGAPLVINAGQTVTFTSTSTSPATLNSWNWTFTGGSPASHNGQTPPAITYAAAGNYTVSLTVGDNAAGTDTETKTAYITVNSSGTVTCDSTAAGWDWNTENFGGATWGVDATACANTVHAGYILGNNCFDDNGWATKVNFSGTGKQLTDVLYVFVQSSGTGAATLKVWNANGTGQNTAGSTISTAPGTVLKSQAITTGQFSANLNQFIQLPITPAIPLTGNFYIGYEHNVTPLNGDTIVMGVADATTNMVWAKESGIGWRDVNYWGSGTGGVAPFTPIAYKGTVVPVICDIPTGVLSHIGNVTNVEVRPNPSTGFVNVIMPTETTNFKVAVYNMLGEEVASDLFTSNYAKLDLSNQPNGIYFVKVSSNGEVTTNKIILSK